MSAYYDCIMRTNADFGKFLFELKPQTRPALLTFYNYLRNFTELQAAFTPDVVARFYLKALSFEHWQKNILELSQDIKFVLEKYWGSEMQTPAWKSLRHADELQVLKIKNKRDQLEMIRKFILLKEVFGPNSHTTKQQVQIFADKNNVAHAVILFPQGRVQVFTFDDMAYIQDGQIFPLVQDRKIEYTENLEPAPGFKQLVSISPFISAKFSLENGMIHGNWIRGYTLQNYRKIDIHELHQEPQLLHAIKRIERFFIDRTSEPLYMELVGVLEQTIDFLCKDLDGSVELAQKSFLRGQNALENIFIDDKMLEVLLKEIHTLLTNKGQRPWIPQRQNENQTPGLYESINSSRKPEFLHEEELTDSSSWAKWSSTGV